jgi:hypothetical protein
MIKTSILFVLVYLSVTTKAVTSSKTYVVYFTSKDSNNFNPFTYFNEEAITFKKKHHLPLFDYRDLPIKQDYLTFVKSNCNEVLVESRWLNAIFIKAFAHQIEKIKLFPFVIKVEEYSTQVNKQIASQNLIKTTDENNLLVYQTARFKAKEFENKNLTGKGIRIAVFDVGFSGANKHPAFQHLRKNNQIKATYDFIKKSENVYLGGAHGTNTLSCITGIHNSNKLGMATDAEFLLARTEWGIKENKQEEYFWLAAAEWAHKNGANIISSSLGYGGNWYKVSDMDGKKSVVAFAATVAAQKGILVINSAGNEYQDSWKTIITPADADSVLCVGGINPYTDFHINFSSVGPSADHRAKPNVSAPGHDIVANPNGSISESFGTSFSCPLVTGFAACAWQSNMALTNMQLFHEIEKSGHLYPYFDYMHGKGVPQADYFTKNTITLKPSYIILDSFEQNKEFSFLVTDSTIIQTLRKSEESNYVKENKNKKNYNFYWNITDENNVIKYYQVILIYTNKEIKIKSELLKKGCQLNFHFVGISYTKTIEIARHNCIRVSSHWAYIQQY